MFKVEAVVNGDQLETLLLAARACGVTLQLGVHLPDVPSPRRKAKGKPSTKRRRKIRHSRFLTVKMGKRPESPPRLVEVHEALSAEFGGRDFLKKDAKPVIVKRMRMRPQSVSPYVTKLMDAGGLVASH